MPHGEIDAPVRALLAELHRGGPAGAGAIAGATLAMAADVIAGAARRSADVWPEARGVAAQAGALHRRGSALARENADAFAGAMAALRPEGDGPGGDLGDRLDRAADVPLRLAQLGADVAALGALVGEHAEPDARPDAVAAAELAAGAARAAAHLVAVNLTVTGDDARVAAARDAARAATAALDRA